MQDRILSGFIVLICTACIMLGFRWGRVTAPPEIIESIVVDSNVVEVTVPVHDTIPFQVIDTVDYPLGIDTNAIVQDYLLKKEFEVSFRDTNLAINIRPVIAFNSLDSLSFDYRILRPTVINKIQPKSVTEWYGGLEAGRMNVSPFVQVNVKDKWLIGVNYNLLDQSTSLSFGVRLF